MARLGLRAWPVPGAKAAGLTTKADLWSLTNYVDVHGRPVPGVGGVKDPTPWCVPGAQAAGLIRRSPLKGLGTLGVAGGRTGYAGMSPSQPL